MVVPKPWWNPSFEKLALNLDSGQATLKSAAKATPNPPPTAAPCITAIIGFVVLNNLTAWSYKSA